jgi:hypothetical protein
MKRKSLFCDTRTTEKEFPPRLQHDILLYTFAGDIPETGRIQLTFKGQGEDKAGAAFGQILLPDAPAMSLHQVLAD